MNAINRYSRKTKRAKTILLVIENTLLALVIIGVLFFGYALDYALNNSSLLK
jgi:hypothetical protein